RWRRCVLTYLSILVGRGRSDCVLKALDVTEATDSRSESCAALSGDRRRRGAQFPAPAPPPLRAANSESDSPACNQRVLNPSFPAKISDTKETNFGL
ncbi:hypothetical protein HW555_004192, partial [Spodoptera exigua]